MYTNMKLPEYANTEIGYAMWWLSENGRHKCDDAELTERLKARGHLDSDRMIAEVIRRAHLNVALAARLRSCDPGRQVCDSCNDIIQQHGGNK